MALFPTKKISALSPAAALTGFEEFECVQGGNSRKATSRQFVLPTDSLLTVSAMGGSLPGSRQMIAGIGIAFIDNGPGSTLSINSTGAVAGPANPTALVGLAAVNGAALTYMRSDAAPALDQSIAPTWTGNHNFTANQNQVSNAAPQWIFTETDAAADNRAWPIRISGEQFTIGALNDLGSVFTPWVSVDRTGTVIDLVNLTATTVQVNGQNVRDAAILTSGTVATARLGSGAANATTWLRGDQTWQTLPGSFTGFANPTASVGLAAVNGAATTAMRSDAAPALSQSIAPTWTGRHIFAAEAIDSQASAAVAANRPEFDISENDAAADNRRWNLAAVSEQLRFRTLNDAGTVSVNWLAVDRTGTTVDAIALISTSLTWNGNPLLSTATAFANPTGTVGLATVNGVATTAMRSDAAPPLSQAIAPTWSAQHIFSLSGTASPAINLSSAIPVLQWNETDAAADNRRWLMYPNGEQWVASVRNDANSVETLWLTVDRTGTTVDSLIFPNGAVIFRGGITGATTTQSQIGVRAATPSIILTNATPAADNRNWETFVNTAGTFAIRTLNDAASSSADALVISRSGTTISTVSIPAVGDNLFLVGTSALVLTGYQMGVSASSSRGAIVAKGDNTTAAAAIAAWNPATAGDNVFEVFGTEAAFTQRGSITYNRGAGLTAYNTTSDSRRKKNVRDSGDAGDLIDRIQVRAFDWVDSDIHLEHWVIAQELHAVMPMAVSKGGPDQDWSVDISKLVPLLIKEVQSMRRRLAIAGV